ncbi:MAG: hypothetical protein WCR23_12875 [Planctomycetota bacterium]
MARIHNWGTVGWSTEWTAIDQANDSCDEGSGAYGFVRVVDPGVVYFTPPLVDGHSPWRKQLGHRERTFEMIWSEDSQPGFQTVLDIHAGLASRRASLEKDDEKLRFLDQAISQMVALAHRAHQAGATLGFIQPESAVFGVRRDGSLFVTFPDLGFAWDDARGLQEPKWITEPTLDCFFEKGARKQNAAYLARLRPESAPKELVKRTAELASVQAEDVKLLARLIAVALAGREEVQRWCGTSGAFIKMPDRNLAPDTEAPIWDEVIAPALAGTISTCADMLSRLESAKPSQHFLFKPPVPPPAWLRLLRRSMFLLGGILTAAFLAFAVVLIARWIFPPPPPPHPLCSKVASTSPLYQRLPELETLRAAAFESGATGEHLTTYFNVLLECKSARSSVFHTKQADVDCLGSLFEQYADRVEERAQQFLIQLRTKPLAVHTEIEMLNNVVGMVKEAAAQTAPPRASKIAARLEKQLILRGAYSPPQDSPQSQDKE